MEKSKDNKFAYFNAQFGKSFMSMSEFLDVVKDKDEDGARYYYSEDIVPEELKGDFKQPEIAEKSFKLTEINMWYGMNTISLPHTDAMENFMCVV